MKLIKALSAIGDAGVFKNILPCGKEPELVLDNGPAQRSDGVLARKRLLRIWFGVVECVAGVQRLLAEKAGDAAVPVVCTAARRDHYGPAVRTRGIGVELSSADGELLYGFW